MAYEELTQQNPLRVLNMSKGGHMGLVMARAGLGKTALLVQIALDAILRGKRVIHVGVGEGIDKTKARYDDILQSILRGACVEKPHELIDMVNRHRMIMTFQASAFTRARLEERLNDLMLQNIFTPDCLIIDGLDFSSIERSEIEDFKNMATTKGFQAWFSAIKHREDPRISLRGVPAPCHEMDDLFDTVIVLNPREDATIDLQFINLSNEAGGEGLRLDPTTMMIKKD